MQREPQHVELDGGFYASFDIDRSFDEFMVIGDEDSTEFHFTFTEAQRLYVALREFFG